MNRNCGAVTRSGSMLTHVIDYPHCAAKLLEDNGPAVVEKALKDLHTDYLAFRPGSCLRWPLRVDMFLSNIPHLDLC